MVIPQHPSLILEEVLVLFLLKGKQIKNILLSVFFIVFIGTNSFSYDFKVSIEGGGYETLYFKPIQSGETFTFKIKVENRSYTETDSIRIDKDDFIPSNYFKLIDTVPKEIKPRKTVEFKVKVSIPTGEPEGEYYNRPSLKLYDENNSQYTSIGSFGGDNRILIDNTPPTDVEIHKKNSSGKKIIVSPTAYDIMSSYYTSWNEDKGKDGIAKFAAQLKNLQGAVLATKEVTIKNSWENIVLKSSAMEANTNYNVYVTATDLAGNTSAPAFLQVTTPSDPPTNLQAKNIAYHTFTLHWTAAAGATDYEIYDVTGNSEELVGTSSTTQFVVEGLKMGETRKYMVKSVSEGGTSYPSNEISVTTLKLEISGSYSVCNQATYGLKNNIFPSSTFVHWSTSNSKLQLVSGQSTSNAKFKSNGYGACTIKVKIADIEATKKVHVGTVANIPFTVNSQSGSEVLCKDVMNELVVNLSTSEALSQTISEYEWKVSDPSWQLLEHPAGSGNPNSNSSVYISIRARNTCGWGEWSLGKYFTAENCQRHTSVNYFISPNGDGKNDTWVLTYNVTIFNKKGNIIYRKENYMQDEERFSGVGNTGEYSGRTLPDGDYFFTITGSITESGHIYIKRE